VARRADRVVRLPIEGLPNGGDVLTALVEITGDEIGQVRIDPDGNSARAGRDCRGHGICSVGDGISDPAMSMGITLTKIEGFHNP